MAAIRDFMVILLCDELTEQRDPNPMEPLITYLEDGAPLTPRLRNWLITLFKPDKTQRHYLKLKTRPGRPPNTTFDRDTLVNECAAELDGSIITNALCRKLLAITGMSVAEPDIAHPETHRFGWHERDDLGDWIPVSLTLKIGKKLNALQVLKATAANFEISISAVKRILAARKLAMTAGD